MHEAIKYCGLFSELYCRFVNDVLHIVKSK